MFITPFRYTYQADERLAKKNKLLFERGCQQSVWKLNAYAVYVYKFSNVIMLFKSLVIGMSKEQQK